MEAEFLRWLKTTLQSQTKTQPGIGDDCSTMELDSDKVSVITTDALIDQVHFNADTDSLEQIGWKALAVNLSDIAAMGASPSYAVVSLIAPKNYSIGDLQTLYQGLFKLANQTGTQIIGGDFNTHLGPLTISVTAIGQAKRTELRYRFTTQAADRIFVTGPLGRSILGHHLRFHPRITEGRILANCSDVHSVTDVTDGLVVDLHSMLPDGLGAELIASQIPCRHPSNDFDSDLRHALFDGEDFELLFTLDPKADLGDLTSSLRGDIYEIGVVNQSHQISIQHDNRPRQVLDIIGYEH